MLSYKIKIVFSENLFLKCEFTNNFFKVTGEYLNNKTSLTQILLSLGLAVHK